MIGANLGSIDKEVNRAIPSLILHCCVITLPSAPPFKRPQCRHEYQIRYQMQACGLLVLMAGFLIHFTIGISLTFGNLLPYLVSYSRLYSGPSELRYTDAVYVFSALLVVQYWEACWKGSLAQDM